jgi:hypothetical protein
VKKAVKSAKPAAKRTTKKGPAKKAPAKKASPPPAAPAKPAAPVIAAPPPPPPPPPPRDELIAPRDIARLTRYGERFGAHKIDIQWHPTQLPVASSAIAVCDPGVPKNWRVLDRPIGAGVFRVMLSLARDGDKARLAAVTVHVGRPPIAKWTVAHYRGQKKPKSPDQLPACAVTTGWLVLVDGGDGPPGPIAVPAASGTDPVDIPLTDGRRALALPCGNGEYVAYWAVDAADKPICLVIDFDVFTQKDWKAKPT